MHQLNQASANRQPKSGPAKLARDGTVGLKEALKKILVYFDWYPDAGIDHLEPQARRFNRIGECR
jgi:hypothetical protein